MMSLQKGFNFIDKIFNKAQTVKYYMSIRLETDGLFVSVYDPVVQKYIALEKSLHGTSSELYSYISKHEWIGNPFAKKVIVFPSKQYTLVPRVLLKRDSIIDYLKFVHEIKPGFEVLSLEQDESDSTLIYSVDRNYIDIADEFFSGSKIIPQPGAFMRLVLPKYKNSRSSMIFINLYNEDFDILVLEEGKMRFFNNFISKSYEDLVYYLVFVIDQLSLNPESAKVLLSGNIEDKSSLMRLLKKYVRFVEIMKYDSNLDNSYALNEVEKHKYLDILNPMLCEL